MLIDFKVRNWMSFRDDTQFSMEGTEIEKFSKKLPWIDKYELSVLPISMIFGGNASGKSNFVEAIKFAKKLIVDGTKQDDTIALFPFFIDKNSSDSRFKFVILIDEIIYEYSFSLNQERITNEKLSLWDDESKKVLFHRKSNGKGIELHNSLEGNKSENGNFLRKMARGTRDNQLFLTNSTQYEETFLPVFEWFRKSLLVITAATKFQDFDLFFESKHRYAVLLNEIIPKLNLGVFSVEGTKIPYEQIELPEDVRVDLDKNLKKDGSKLYRFGKKDWYLFTFDKGKIIAKKLVTFHKNSAGKKIPFEFSQESDGTRRIIDLLPAFWMSFKQDKVLVIDEIDRSIHPLLIKKIIESYLEKCNPKFRSQLIFTTHNVGLLDEKILRADEFWIAHKNVDGASELQSLNEFKGFEGFQGIENFRKEYLEGRYRGIPQFQNEGIF